MTYILQKLVTYVFFSIFENRRCRNFELATQVEGRDATCKGREQWAEKIKLFLLSLAFFFSSFLFKHLLTKTILSMGEKSPLNY